MMTNINEVSISRLIFGTIVSILAALFLIHTFRKAKKDKTYDVMSYSFDLKIVVGTALILIAAMVLIYKELSKLQFTLIVLILFPLVNYSQDKQCDDLLHGVFGVYENGEKTGLVYRENGFQLEDYLDGKKLKTATMREEDCSFYIKSIEIKNDLDTITMFVVYNRIKQGYYTFLAKPKYLNIDYEYRGEIKKIDNEIRPEIIKIFEKLENDNKSVLKQ